MNRRTWCVYKHIFPNGKIYIGITGKNPEQRWNNGFGYVDNKRMFKDIVFFGWRNIKHEILFDELSEDEAQERERELIRSFGEDGRKKTYNHQFASYGKDYGAWADYVINEQRINKYRDRFLELDDQWINTLRATTKYTNWAFELNMEGVRVVFIYESIWDLSEPLLAKQLFAKYPYDDMTFREINAWLNGNPNFEVEVDIVSDVITEKRLESWKAWELIKATYDIEESPNYSGRLHNKEVVNVSAEPPKIDLIKLCQDNESLKELNIIISKENNINKLCKKSKLPIIDQASYNSILDEICREFVNCREFRIEYTIFMNPSYPIKKGTLLNISREQKSLSWTYKKHLQLINTNRIMKKSKYTNNFCQSQCKMYHINY